MSVITKEIPKDEVGVYLFTNDIAFCFELPNYSLFDRESEKYLGNTTLSLGLIKLVKNAPEV